MIVEPVSDALDIAVLCKQNTATCSILAPSTAIPTDGKMPSAHCCGSTGGTLGETVGRKSAATAGVVQPGGGPGPGGVGGRVDRGPGTYWCRKALRKGRRHLATGQARHKTTSRWERHNRELRRREKMDTAQPAGTAPKSGPAKPPETERRRGARHCNASGLAGPAP